MKFLTISWDDGFKKSSIKTAAIYEKYGLRAEFNIVAQHSSDTFSKQDSIGDFGLWKELETRGHIIQPHSCTHAHLTQMSLRSAIEDIERSYTILTENLNNFSAERAVFNFPYNESSAEIEEYLFKKGIPFRTGPGPALNPLPGKNTLKVTTCGWEEAEEWLDRCIKDLEQRESGWLVYNAHGLDREGWGPIRSSFLQKTLDHVLSRGDIKVLPVIEVLELFR